MSSDQEIRDMYDDMSRVGKLLANAVVTSAMVHEAQRKSRSAHEVREMRLTALAKARELVPELRGLAKRIEDALCPIITTAMPGEG